MTLDPFDNRLYNEGWDWGDSDDEIAKKADSVDTVLGQALEAAQRLQRNIHDETNNLKVNKFDIDVITFLIARAKFMLPHYESKPNKATTPSNPTNNEPLLPYTPSSNDKKMLNNMGIKENKKLS